MPHRFACELATAAQLIEEVRLITEATGNPPVAYTDMFLAAWRGRGHAAELSEATVQDATARGQGRLTAPEFPRNGQLWLGDLWSVGAVVGLIVNRHVGEVGREVGSLNLLHHLCTDPAALV